VRRHGNANSVKTTTTGVGKCNERIGDSVKMILLFFKNIGTTGVNESVTADHSFLLSNTTASHYYSRTIDTLTHFFGKSIGDVVQYGSR
jgi:hypothetical protein